MEISEKELSDTLENVRTWLFYQENKKTGEWRSLHITTKGRTLNYIVTGFIKGDLFKRSWQSASAALKDFNELPQIHGDKPANLVLPDYKEEPNARKEEPASI